MSLSSEDREALNSVLVYLWSATGRAGSNSRQSQIDYGKRKGAEVVEQIVARAVTAALNEAADRVAGLNASGWRAESDHDCDGTEEVCAVRCPIQVQVQVSPVEIRAAILTAAIPPT